MTTPGWANRTTWTGDTPHIELTQADLKKATSFALEAQPETNPDSRTKCEHLRNLRVGKLGEIAFRKWVISRGRRPLGDRHMFRVWKGWGNVDKHDFKTLKGKTIDVKTFDLRSVRPWGRIMDFYVEARVNPNETGAYIMGYASGADILWPRQGEESRDAWLIIYRDAVKMDPTTEQSKITTEIDDSCFTDGELRNIEDLLSHFPPLGEPASSPSGLIVYWLLLAAFTIWAALTFLS